MTTVDDLIAEIERSYAELTEQLADPEVLGDRVRYAEAARAHAELQPVHELTRGYREAQLTVTDAEALLADGSTDAEMRAFAQEELADGRRRLGELADEIRARVLTRDPNDGKDVILEIRAGAGGNEACIFAGELARMYTRYAQAKGFDVEILSANENDDGGFKEMILEVRGQGAYSALKYEGGVHRVQRVPVTNPSAVSTRPPRRSPCSPRPRTSRSTSAPAICAWTSSAPAGRAVRASTPPTPPCASRTSPVG